MSEDHDNREEPDLNQALIFGAVAVVMTIAVVFGFWLFVHLPPP